MRRLSNRQLRNILLLVSTVLLFAYLTVFYSMEEKETRTIDYGHQDVEDEDPCQTDALVRNISEDCSETKCFRHLTKCALGRVMVQKKAECRSKRFLVYKCDDSQCGGWGDRLKGIMSSFLLALLTDRVFVINMKQPCGLESFVDHRIYDWSICKDFVNSFTHTYSVDIVKSKTDLVKTISDIHVSFETVIEVTARINLIYDITSYQYATDRLEWIIDLPAYEIAHVLFNTLFKEGPSLMRSKKEMLETIGYERKRACAHIRVGRNPSNPADSIPYNGIGRREIDMVLSFLQNYSLEHQYSLYIASDSNTVKKLARKINSMYVFNRTVVHIDLPSQDRFSSEVCDGLFTALLEHYFLTSCDILLLTRSNFGVTAAYIRGSDEGLFILSHQNNLLGNGIVQVTLADLQNVFNFN